MEILLNISERRHCSELGSAMIQIKEQYTLTSVVLTKCNHDAIIKYDLINQCSERDLIGVYTQCDNEI